MLWTSGKCAWSFLVGAVLVVAGCAPVAPPPGAPKAEGPKWPPAGSSWVLTEKNTGSYGSGSGQITLRALGEQTWDGKKAMAFTDGTDTFYLDLQARFLAVVRGTTPRLTFEPYDAAFSWPLFVGKSWVNRFRMRDHERGRTFDTVEWDGEVTAFEEVKTPAGTFKAFKVVHQNPFSRTTRWWSPDLGIYVRSQFERFGGNYLGVGSRETELVSYELKR
jgi:hypothetical protein